MRGAPATTLGSANLTLTNSVTNESWLNNSSNTLTLAGAITPLAAGTLILGGSGNINVTATTPASNTGLITKTGTGTPTWTSDINTTGNLTINDGVFFLNMTSTASSDMTNIAINNTAIFRVAGGAGLSGNSIITIAAGAAYQNNLTNDTISGLVGTGTVSTSLTTGTTSLNLSSTTNRTFDGVIQDNGAGKFAITKQNTNTVTLTGASTYTGGTIISQGTARLGLQRHRGQRPHGEHSFQQRRRHLRDHHKHRGSEPHRRGERERQPGPHRGHRLFRRQYHQPSRRAREAP